VEHVASGAVAGGRADGARRRPRRRLDTAAWIAPRQSDVVFSSFFKGQDPSLNATWFYGLFYADGTPKKPAPAFSLWHDLTACERLLGVAVSGASDARSLTRSVAAGGATVGAGRLRVRQAHDEDAGVRGFTPASSVVVMPAECGSLPRRAEPLRAAPSPPGVPGTIRGARI